EHPTSITLSPLLSTLGLFHPASATPFFVFFHCPPPVTVCESTIKSDYFNRLLIAKLLFRTSAVDLDMHSKFWEKSRRPQTGGGSASTDSVNHSALSAGGCAVRNFLRNILTQ